MGSHSHPAVLSGSVRHSFAYDTLHRRVPVTLASVVNTLHLLASSLHDDLERKDQIHELLTSVGQLKYDLAHNKPLVEFKQPAADLALWNTRVTEAQGKGYFQVSWLLAECYVYRRIREAILGSKDFKDLDPFEGQKKATFEKSMESELALALLLETEYLVPQVNRPQAFEDLVQFSLWGNQADLSLHNDPGKQNHVDLKDLQKQSKEQLGDHHKHILVDDCKRIWQLISSWDKPKRIDFILDNAGPELFSDLCLAIWLTESRIASEIHFHVKEFGWFVSDVTAKDFQWMVLQMSSATQPEMKKLGHLSQKYLAENRWLVKSDPFWTSGEAFWETPSLASALYSDLSASSLILIKGDLNYRKLTYDCQWDPTTPFEVATGPFKPSPFVALRTNKADVIVGLEPGRAEQLTEEEKGNTWMTSGKFGVIQLCIPQNH